MPSTGRPAAARARDGVGQPGRAARPGPPRWRGCPGSTTRSASASSAGRVDAAHRDAGLGGQRVHVGEVGHPGQPRPRPPAARPSPAGGAGRAERAARAPRASPRRPATARPATAARRAPAARSAPCSLSSPGASSRASPRNLLTTKPAISAWSAGVEQRRRCRTARRTRRRGRCRRRRRPAGRAAWPAPCSRCRSARRLISAGLPAPSQITTSNARRRSASVAEHALEQRGLQLAGRPAR